MGTGSSKVCGDGRTGPFSVLFVCCGCVNWTLVQSKPHRTMTARYAPRCTQCMIFDACVVKNMIAPCSTAPRTLSFPKIVVKQKVWKSTKNVAKAGPRNSTLDPNRFHKIVGKVHTQIIPIVITFNHGSNFTCQNKGSFQYHSSTWTLSGGRIRHGMCCWRAASTIIGTLTVTLRFLGHGPLSRHSRY